MSQFELELQPFVPYADALRWSLQAAYYETAGPEAWLKKDVPNMVTCNSFAAMQNALVVFDVVRAQIEQQHLSPDDPVVVLEYGAGHGLFAYNFIRRFEQVCKRDGETYHERLVYIATDYAESNVRALAQQRFLQPEIQRGRLRIAQADALTAKPLRFITVTDTGEAAFTEEPTPALCAVFASYLHCCLPVEFLRHEGDQWEEKTVRTTVTLTEEEASAQITAQDLLQQPRIVKRLKEEERWQPIVLNEHCIDAPHENALGAVVAGRAKSTLLNPKGSLANLKLMEQHLRPCGVYLIHDKGHVDTTAYNFGGVHGRSTHGNSTAYLVNFPLLRAYAEQLGLCVHQTRSRQLSLHTLLLEKSGTPTLTRLFRYLYSDFNLNNDMVDMQLMSHTLEKHGELLTAAEVLQKCLRYRSLDVDLHYALGMYYLKLDMGQRALLCVRHGRPVNHFGQYNFDMIEGCAHKVLENFTLACKILNRALAEEENPIILQAIEKELFDCHLALGLPAEDFTIEHYPALAKLPATNEAQTPDNRHSAQHRGSIHDITGLDGDVSMTSDAPTAAEAHATQQT